MRLDDARLIVRFEARKHDLQMRARFGVVEIFPAGQRRHMYLQKRVKIDGESLPRCAGDPLAAAAAVAFTAAVATAAARLNERRKDERHLQSKLKTRSLARAHA